MIFDLPLNVRRDIDATLFLKAITNKQRVFILHGLTKSRVFKSDLGLDEYPSIAVNGKENITQLLMSNRDFNTCQSLIAVGGGSVIDTAKRCALLYNKHLIVIPSVIANDGLISPISVLDVNGIKTSLPGKMPEELLLIMRILSQAPERYVNASLLDSLSNISASHDWRYYSGTFQMSDEVAATLSEVSGNYLACLNVSNKDDKLKLAIEQQILSGISMLLAGSSQPCSGSEHILCRIADRYVEFENYLHGELVGTFSLFTKFLQNTLTKQDIHFVNSIFSNWTEIFGIITERIGPDNFFNGCHNIRSDRKSILDQYEEHELSSALSRFLKYVH